MSQVIAQRTLTGVFDGKVAEVEIRLFLPERHLNGEDWECRYEIEWPITPRSHVVNGVDAMQALLLAMACTAADLYAGQPPGLSGLTWLEPGGGFGFPLPPSLRGLAQGDDRLI